MSSQKETPSTSATSDALHKDEKNGHAKNGNQQNDSNDTTKSLKSTKKKKKVVDNLKPSPNYIGETNDFKKELRRLRAE